MSGADTPYAAMVAAPHRPGAYEIAQTARRLAGETTIHRSIRRGKPQKPKEFGYTVSVADSAEGFVVLHQVYAGNPHDTSTLRDAVA